MPPRRPRPGAAPEFGPIAHRSTPAGWLHPCLIPFLNQPIPTARQKPLFHRPARAADPSARLNAYTISLNKYFPAKVLLDANMYPSRPVQEQVEVLRAEVLVCPRCSATPVQCPG